MSHPRNQWFAIAVMLSGGVPVVSASMFELDLSYNAHPVAAGQVELIEWTLPPAMSEQHSTYLFTATEPPPCSVGLQCFEAFNLIGIGQASAVSYAASSAWAGRVFYFFIAVVDVQGQVAVSAIEEVSFANAPTLAKFEPPSGRIMHGMGQWNSGNAQYLDALSETTLQPAITLAFLPLADGARFDPDKLASKMQEHADAGRVWHANIELTNDVQTPLGYSGIDAAIADGSGVEYLERVEVLAQVIKQFGGPVMLRIGGEFNGPWNDYHPWIFPQAYRAIVDIFREVGADNAAFIWCYAPMIEGDDFDVCLADDPDHCKWYPGEDYIDWYSVDVFNLADFEGPLTTSNGQSTAHGRTRRFIEMAVQNGKPIIIGEASAISVDITPNWSDGVDDWDDWFEPFFDFIESDPAIKAFHYINADWAQIDGFAQQGWLDANVAQNGYIMQQLILRLSDERYLHSGELPLINGFFVNEP